MRSRFSFPSYTTKSAVDEEEVAASCLDLLEVVLPSQGASQWLYPTGTKYPRQPSTNQFQPNRTRLDWSSPTGRPSLKPKTFLKEILMKFESSLMT